MSKWIVVAFSHPAKKKSIIYEVGRGTKGLLELVKRAANMGANLMSIRGFPE